MKIAAVVITYNDSYKLNQWKEHHLSYKNELYLHIIVDNGSNPVYLKSVEDLFTDSVIIRRTSNAGCTGAYNDGINYALSDPLVDAIMLIGNDIRIEEGGITKLYEFLKSKKEYGMVAPILLSKDSEEIEDFGCRVSKNLYMLPYSEGKYLDDVNISVREIEAVTGGMNIARRDFYETIGLQDENLFMYSDEVDMAIRAKKSGFKMAVTKQVKAWHQHINPANSNLRIPLASYLIGRNKVYLGWKHFGLIAAIRIFIYQVSRFVYSIPFALQGKQNFKNQIFFLWGAINGFLKNMKKLQ